MATVAVLALLSGCAGSSGNAVPTFVPPTPGASSAASFISRPTYIVTTDTLREEIVTRGELAAAQQVSLYFTVSGIVKDVAVAPGQEVEAGTVLATLNAPSQEQDLLQRESNLIIAQLDLARIEARTPSTETLSETSPEYFDLATARQRLVLAQALYDFSKAQYEQTILVAPFAGTLSSFGKQRGNPVTPYETVGMLADLSSMTVQAWLPADARDRVTVGDPAQISIDGYGATTYTGAVAAIAGDATVWQGELAFPMTIALDPGQSLPLATQLAAGITLPGEVHADVPWVPVSALTTIGNQAYVDVLRTATIERVPVQVGITNGQQAEIVSGIAVGDTIVFP
jgi:membrane fusion protein (multidrug efflux system)